MKQFFIIAAVLVWAVTGYGAEPVQPILAELARPMATGISHKEKPALLTAEELALGEEPAKNGAEFFTLEEIASKDEHQLDLDLPDVSLPASDIPLTLNSKVEYFLYYFQGNGRAFFSRWLSRSSRYIPMMKQVLKKEKLPEDLVYVAMIESGFHLQARSWANAVGPWQFISETGRRYSLRIDQWVDERQDPLKATTAAALYLKDLYEMFDGNWYLAAAGYNAGENKILRAVSMYNTSDFWELTRGSYLKRETKEYVPKLLAAAIIAKDPAHYGFADIAYLPPIEFDTVKIPSRTDLELVARLTGTTYEAIRELNPALKHWCTPPNYPDYELNLPKGTKTVFESAYAKISENQRFTEKTVYSRYVAKKRESLTSVAERFGTSPDALAKLNGISRQTRIAGKRLLVPAKQTVNFANEGRTAAKAPKGEFAKYYTVKKGDTLTELAQRFKVSTKLIAAWNNLKTKVALKPGRRLIIAKYVEKNGEMRPVTEKS